MSPVGRSTLVSLGGNKLLAISVPYELAFSDDAGATWEGPMPAETLPDGRTCYTDVAHTPLVEGNTVTFFAYATIEEGYKHWRENQIWGEAFLRRYDLGRREWEDPVFLPEEWGLNEGSIVRAKNGDLLVACRAQMIGTPILSDHWDGLATLRSSDNGKTWSQPVRHFLYGHHHVNLLHLPDGRILMTHVARVGELDGRPYHGVETVTSLDNGVTWDWEHRYLLFRWPNSQVMHSPRSSLRSDGSILTIFQHDAVYSCADEQFPGSAQRLYLGNVSAVIWRLQDAPAVRG
ncbi:MAG: sialidase family protein [Candidatus Latescibacterota bacterium]